MLINSNDIKTTKKHIEVMQAFIDGKEIEYKKKFAHDFGQCTTPTWDFDNYAYRIKPSEPEYIYPIYKRLKTTPETVVKFTSLDAGIYVSTYKNSIYKPGDAALNMAPHTDSSWEDAPRRIMDIVRNSNGKIVDLVDRPSEPEYVYPIYKRLKATPEIIVKFTSIDSGIYIGTEAQSIYKPGDAAKYMSHHTSCSWEDYTVSEDAEKIILNKTNTIELFEVIYYCDGTEEYSIRGSLYSNEDLEELQHLQKTGRSFIIDKDTRQLIKVVNQ